MKKIIILFDNTGSTIISRHYYKRLMKHISEKAKEYTIILHDPIFHGRLTQYNGSIVSTYKYGLVIEYEEADSKLLYKFLEDLKKDNLEVFLEW